MEGALHPSSPLAISPTNLQRDTRIDASVATNDALSEFTLTLPHGLEKLPTPSAQEIIQMISIDLLISIQRWEHLVTACLLDGFTKLRGSIKRFDAFEVSQSPKESLRLSVSGPALFSCFLSCVPIHAMISEPLIRSIRAQKGAEFLQRAAPTQRTRP